MPAELERTLSVIILLYAGNKCKRFEQEPSKKRVKTHIGCMSPSGLSSLPISFFCYLTQTTIKLEEPKVSELNHICTIFPNKHLTSVSSSPKLRLPSHFRTLPPRPITHYCFLIWIASQSLRFHYLMIYKCIEVGCCRAQHLDLQSQLLYHSQALHT